MSFDDTPEEAAFRAEARAWLEAHAVPKGSAEDFSKAFHGIDSFPVDEQRRIEAEHALRCRRWQATLHAGGWAGVTWPEEHGGRGGTPTEGMIFAEEQRRFGVSADAFAVAIGMVGPTLIAHGSEAQKERFLDTMLRGDHIWCQLFSEPGAGSDLAGLSTRAVRDGDEFVVNGQKVWTSGAHSSDWGILLARTNPDVPKHRGITYFVVDMTSPGIEVRPLRQITGAAHFAEVFLTDVRLPASAVVGDVDGGWGVAMTTLANERALIGGGMHYGAADLADLARRHGRDGDPVVRAALADVHSRQEILRFMGYRLRTAAARGRQPGPEANCMKLAVARYLKVSSELALAIAGPDGMLRHTPAPGGATWQHHFLSAPSIRIAGGSDEVQRNIIGERVLGLPGDVRMDKDVPFRLLGAG